MPSTGLPDHSISPGMTPEKVVKYTYDVHTDKWVKTQGMIVLNDRPFDEGNMRQAFFMLDLSLPEAEQKYVAKMSKNPNEDKSVYFMDIEMQALAQSFAIDFCKQKPPKLVTFNDCALVKCMERRGNPLLAIEPYMSGSFKKHSNNYGFVSYDDRNTPQAFSHFTYCRSGGKLLICDIQGVGDRYTDPQIHSRDGRGFGKGNMGYEGMLHFFKTHHCNSICEYLGLPQHNPKQNDRGTTPHQDQMMQRLSQRRAGPADEAAQQDPNQVEEPIQEEVPENNSPRQEQPHLPPDDPLDVDMLGLTKEQLAYIKSCYNKCTKTGTDRMGKRGLVALCEMLGYAITVEEAREAFNKLDVLEVGTIDLRQFVWWWCGIEE
eukprot:NODE_2930_length_1312_cov_131.705635_g2781_i0.p1 GENE.NODE_2930_length_1312_cov_131.705635_g2781_i0~~NODE_2930_length_1312_cov_131.705635_g2781_i0.p1  ORF type:complete len:375 (-),score=54.88 NODE_2930_length_1312_cov_131.705635_g2781_i0:125-1249(-)